MMNDEIEKIVRAKYDEAYKSTALPKKFFITENGRGVVDGGDMYNALVKDVLEICQKATIEIFKAAHDIHKK